MALTFYTGDFLIIYAAVSILLSILLTISSPQGLWQMLSSLRAFPQCVFFFPHRKCVLATTTSSCHCTVMTLVLCVPEVQLALWQRHCVRCPCPQRSDVTLKSLSACGLQHEQRKAKLHPHLDREKAEDRGYEDRLEEEARLAGEADAGLTEDEEWCLVTWIIWWLVLFVTRAGCWKKMSFWWKFDPFVILRAQTCSVARHHWQWNIWDVFLTFNFQLRWVLEEHSTCANRLFCIAPKW